METYEILTLILFAITMLIVPTITVATMIWQIEESLSNIEEMVRRIKNEVMEREKKGE